MLARWSHGLHVAAGGLLCFTAAAAAGPPSAVLAGAGSADAQRLLEWIKRTGDHRGGPFAVVDKRNARILVYDGAGVLAGQSPALLGATRGDHTLAGVGRRTQTGDIGPDERTTPAGRFDAVPGLNLGGEPIVWVDYTSAFAIHRVRPGAAEAPRRRRLASASPHDNRASSGCVVVPVRFYEQVVQRVLGKYRSVVYVLPETRRPGEFMTALEQQ
ncbi:MAG: hypothetical protein JWP65_3475 [Ramlibacter sp.]|jgi:hypothetical protein|uniref:L,D-transpeptidase n=1 Tax=Ramlibacter sp. TaxID=1917967 RepID=UPI00260E1556|nr:L,D-transpeptidase [Ramlibacter sp.]MDB5753054.1 hypothetical protein [Ramlibacter sp.]